MQSTERNKKLNDINSAVLDKLATSCAKCGISSDIIDKQSFACFPESPTHVTFRARLGGSSETDSGSLISLLESWVSGGATIIVTGVLMTVDPECSVAISSLSEGEFSMSTRQPPDTNTPTSTDSTGTPSSDSQSSTDNTAAVIGGVVAVILIITLAIAIIAIVALMMKSRCHGDLSIKKAEE